MADELNPQIVGEWLAGMSLPERARTLNRIAHSLTVCTREFEAATQPFNDPAMVIKEADRPQRIAASAFCTGWPLYGWRRDQGLSDRYLCEDSLREDNLLSDPALFEGSD